MKALNEKVREMYKKSVYLRDKTFKCDTDNQTQRVREEQNDLYMREEFFKKLRKAIEKGDKK